MAVLEAMTRERRSRAGSVTRSSIPIVAVSCLKRIKLASKIVMARDRCCAHRGAPSLYRKGLRRWRLCRRRRRFRDIRRRRNRPAQTRSGRLRRQTRRWVVERFFAWINRNRRLAKDFEASIASATAFLYAASIMLLVRRTQGQHEFRNRLLTRRDAAINIVEADNIVFTGIASNLHFDDFKGNSPRISKPMGGPHRDVHCLVLVYVRV